MDSEQSDRLDEWLDALTAPYFAEACRRALDSYFLSQGFAFNEAESSRAWVTYSRDDLYVDFLHWPEDSPQYSLMVGVGVGGVSVHHGVGLWYVVQEMSLGNDEDASGWFSGLDELEAVLVRVRDGVLETHFRDWWSYRPILIKLIEQDGREHEAEEAAQVSNLYQERARAAFEQGNMALALEFYKGVFTAHLMPSDKKRMEIASKRVATE